ncbi:MAG: phage head-tail connector protein [Lactobacillus sp.]|nr:phage head-tail connector protein [Lactobacillus sp.]MBD5430002.1 phage head-tail connector protein [Lactobacillus sp.]
MDEPVSLDELKTMLQLKESDMDDVLKLIIHNTVLQTRFKLGLKSDEDFPSEMSYIPLQVCVKRYNKLKNEGMSQYTQEGESITFSANDFDEFLDDLDEWKQDNNDTGVLVHFYNPYRMKEHDNNENDAQS